MNMPTKKPCLQAAWSDECAMGRRSVCACIVSLGVLFGGCGTPNVGDSDGNDTAAARCVEPCIVQEIIDVTGAIGAETGATLTAAALPGGCISEGELGELLEAASLSTADDPRLQFT